MQNDIIELNCHSIDNEGRAIARDGTNRVILVENALAKSKVRAEITELKKNYAIARAIEVLEPSPFQIEAKCAYFNYCGGCTWQNVDYQEQLAYKKQILFDALTRIARIDKENPLLNFNVKAAENIFEYRNKMEFSFGKSKKNELVLGLKSAKSHNVIKVECLLIDSKVNTLIHRLEELCKEYRLESFNEVNSNVFGFLRHAIVRMSKNKNNEIKDFMLEIITYPRQEYNKAIQNICEKIKAEFPFITGIIHSSRKNLLPLAYGEQNVLTIGKTLIDEEIQIETTTSKDCINFKHSNQSFFQVNTNEASALYSATVELILSNPIKTIADIYCGVGGIGISAASALVKLGKEYNLFGLETMQHAIKLAIINARDAQVEAQFTQGNAKNLSKFIEKIQKLDAIILDPPRAGIDKMSMQCLLKKQIPYIILVSCNPATLSRDLKELQDQYSIESIQAFDFFPHTPHVESLVLLKHKEKL